MSHTCSHCTAEVSNGLVLCARCRTTASVALTNLASYHSELLSLGAPNTRGRRRPGAVADPTGGAASRWLDGDLRQDLASGADFAAAETRNFLATWSRSLIEDHAGHFPWPADTVAAMARFLGQHLNSVATLEWAEEFLRELLELEQRLRRIVERGKGRWYAGICSAEVWPERAHDGDSCGCSCHEGGRCDLPGGCHPEVEVIEAEYCDRDLYAVPGTSYVRCPSCRTDHPVADRRKTLLAEARETELPLSTIAHVCVTLLDDEPSVSRLLERLKKWAQRGQLVWTNNDAEVRLYSVGDVLDLLTRRAAVAKR